MIRTIRLMLKTPVLTVFVAFAALLILALLVSSWIDRRREKRIMELKEMAKRQHQLEQQRLRQAAAPAPPAGPAPRETGAVPGHRVT